MTDPLKEAEEQGRAAAIQIIADLVQTRDIDECVSQLRTAAATDTKFNWHLLEAVASFAALGFEASDKTDHKSLD